ncbi:MAG: hypothetical protein IK092_02240, partial [Muribaculaceae bacterium]|nr:hypothetical protein [Muribaculaceae bacterium]
MFEMKHIYKNRILTSAFRVRYSLLFCLLFFVTTLTAAAGFNEGMYYFDNSKVKFQSVRFVDGDTTNCQTIVFEMIPVKDTQWWQLDLSEKLSGIDHYAFIESDMPADTVMMNPRHFVDSLSTVLEDSFKSTILYGMNRTKYGVHYDENNNQSWVYCPMSHDFSTNGYWRPVDSYEAEPSRTLPIIYINTKDSTDVTTKDYYIAGTLWIDNCDIEGYELLGSEKKPLDMELKGRG